MTIRLSRKSISPQEFSKRSPAEQLSLLRVADSRQKSRYLLAADNAEQLMAALPQQSAYLMIKELGVDQLPELLALASGEQWTTFIDLDCWSGDTFDPAKARTWFAVLREAEEEQVLETLRTINFETLLLLLKSEVQVLSGPESFDDDDARAEALRQDGGYQLSYRDEDGAKLFGGLLDVLFRHDPDFYRYLLEGVRSETLSLIAESVLQQRSDRLLDLGFSEPWRAREIYAWLDPETYRQQQHAKVPLGLTDRGIAPGFPVAIVAPTGLFADVLSDEINDEIAWEMTALVNKVLLADNLDVGNLEELRQALTKLDHHLNLALEWLSADKPAAAEILRSCYLEDLFRLGNSLLAHLQRRAQQIAASSIGPYLDTHFQAVINALLMQPPRFYNGLQDAGRDDQQMFQKANELQLAAQALDQLEVQRQLFEKVFEFRLQDPAGLDLSGCQKSSPEELTLADFFLTALANRLMGRAFAPEPLPQADLVKLHALVSEQGHVKTALREQIRSWLEQLHPGAGAFAEFCLDIWADGFCAVAPEDLDPRFLSGLIVRIDRRT